MAGNLDRFIRLTETAVVWLAGAGAVVVLVQMVWISYGVFTRYALNAPDRTVTEATALLLFPVAFAGLAYALREDAYPKVTMLTDHLPAKARKAIAVFNLAIMLGVGLFFSLAGLDATIRSYNSGASSEILLWPRWAFWAPGAVALLLFSIYAALRLVRLVRTPAQEV
ncbi:TRAP-type transport system, small permease component, predicted N-acetylneuraminate transporter [Rhodovulum sp. P5]|uniref:TRAP transporter small permease n=1 Tax=Rhodovulum sp. P5 TaxID=1564506 RepID=UPI0009C2E5A9|nr:TRAP transporter small permease subunit [Rhodovulum sp. P5]ARE40624.1 TRAP-type transport system, small permease component, predicted N-acetylneuraminate transporter [Rhodovulum sp. P5]